nr:hypothetical protein [uncultured Desulfuromonas sp.]
MKTPIRFLFVMLILALLSACSHLHVDLDSNWRLSQDARVAVVVEQPPTEITVSQVTDAVYRLGWQPTNGSSRVDAQLLCRWQRVVDLTDDSEPTKTVKSFHARIINAENGRVLGVADYFYADGELDLWTGVEKALNQLYAQITVVSPVAVEPVAVEPVAVEPVAVEPVAIEPVAIEPVAIKPVAIEPVAIEPVAIEPVAIEPVAIEPVAIEPVAIEPVAIEPVAASSSQTTSRAIDTTQTHVSGVIYQQHAAGQSASGDEESDLQEETAPQSMERSPWIPRFQGMGLENWGEEQESVMD